MRLSAVILKALRSFRPNRVNLKDATHSKMVRDHLMGEIKEWRIEAEKKGKEIELD